MAARQNPNVIRDDMGEILKMFYKISSHRSVCVRKWEGKVFLDMEDTSKCWETGTFQKEKRKNISFTWEQVCKLRDGLCQMEPMVMEMSGQIPDEQMMAMATSALTPPYQNYPEDRPLTYAPLRRNLFRPRLNLGHGHAVPEY